MYSLENAFTLLKSFFDEKGLVRQHLDSYNDFIEHGLQEIVDEVGEIEIDVPGEPYKIKLGRIYIYREVDRGVIEYPYVTEVDGTYHEIYPMEARLRNLTYAMPLSLEMTTVIGDREVNSELAYIGELPTTLKSSRDLL